MKVCIDRSASSYTMLLPFQIGWDNFFTLGQYPGTWTRPENSAKAVATDSDWERGGKAVAFS